MYRYDMTIDGTEYVALFTDHFEACDFLDMNDQDGAEVIVNNYREVTGEEILADDSFEWSYRIEMASELLLPNAHEFPKWTLQEAELQRLGYIA